MRRTRILIFADPSPGSVVAVRQVWRQTEVGRVTCELAAGQDESAAGGHAGFFAIARD